MSQEYMLPVDDLNRMDDLSAAALYRAEVRRIPLLSREEQPPYVQQARAGDTEAQQALLHNCLNWTVHKAYATHRLREPGHTDVMDLVGQANLHMVEALPKALAANDPVAYLMTVSANAMRRYCTYQAPLIAKKHNAQPTDAHPATVSLDGDIAAEAPAQPENTDYKLVYDALAQLSKRHQIVLTAAYGLHGERRMRSEDIAVMLNIPKATVETCLWRAKRRLAAKLGQYVAELGLL